MGGREGGRGGKKEGREERGRDRWREEGRGEGDWEGWRREEGREAAMLFGGRGGRDGKGGGGGVWRHVDAIPESPLMIGWLSKCSMRVSASGNFPRPKQKWRPSQMTR